VTQSSTPWPGGDGEQLAELLRAQGTPPDEIAEATDTLTLLAAWPAPAPSAADTAHLLQRLRPLLPAPSPVRRALRRRPPTLAGEWLALLALVRAQVDVFRPAFWLTSALVMALGILGVLGIDLSPTLALYVSGPLLSYLGAAAAFRGSTLGLLEFELACLPSPRQLMLARLVLVLGYDIVLGLLGGGLLWLRSGTAPLALTLHWLTPLLLVAGVTLLLSLRLPVTKAAAYTYGAWLVVLALRTLATGAAASLAFAASTEVVLGSAGLVFLLAALWALPAATPRMLPHH
jgi:hypothetical protein